MQKAPLFRPTSLGLETRRGHLALPFHSDDNTPATAATHMDSLDHIPIRWQHTALLKLFETLLALEKPKDLAR